MEMDIAESSDKPNISYESIVRFFKAMETPGQCPICGTSSWLIPLKEKGSPVSLVASGLYFEGKPRLSLASSCNKCGFYRFHDVTVILRWLKANPLAEGVVE